MKTNESINFKGLWISKIFATGMYETYCNGRFIQFDNLRGMKFYLTTLWKLNGKRNLI